MNKSSLIGRLTADPILKQTKNNTEMLRFILAVPRRKGKAKAKPNEEEMQAQATQEGQQNEITADFIPCVAWRGIAKTLATYLHQGSRISVEGRLQSNNFVDKAGNKRFSVELNVQDFDFLDGKHKNEQKPDSDGNITDGAKPVKDEDIPF